MSARNGRQVRPAWTLIELLVVIAIIGILMSLLLTAVQSVREAARRAQCADQTRQLVLAFENMESASGRFPSGFTYPGMTMWSGLILPFIEQQSLYQSIDINGPWSGFLPTDPNPNRIALGYHLALLQCPSAVLEEQQIDPYINLPRVPCCYLAVASGLNNRESGSRPWCGMDRYEDPVTGVTYAESDGVFYLNSRTRTAEIVDGLSNTLLIGETIPNQDLTDIDYSGNVQKVDHWHIGSSELFSYADLAVNGSGEISECLGSTACPINAIDDPSLPINDRELSFGSFHPSGVNVGFADGHVRFISKTIDRTTWSALGSRAQHEAVHFSD